jgi:hypothetical protein
MNEPFDVTTPEEKSSALPEEIIIDIHVDLYTGSLPPQQVLPLVLPAKVSVWPKFAAAFKNILGLPKPIGRLIFDILGRHDIADSSSVILGWFVILMAFLLFRGIIPLEVIIKWLVNFLSKILNM